MQISDSRANYNPQFGMALYIPEKGELVKKLGNHIANEIEQVKPDLKILAKRYDIGIFPRKDESGSSGFDRLQIYIMNLTPNSSKNPIRKLWTKLTGKPDFSNAVTDYIYRNRISADVIRARMASLVDKFDIYKQH